MDFERILAKKNKFEQNKSQIDVATIDECEKEFEQKFIYDSCSMEGNPLTFDEVKTILKYISDEVKTTKS